MDGMAKMRECPDCGGTNVVYIEARDQLVCKDCGLVFEPLIPADEEKFEKTHGMALELEMPKEKAGKKAKSAPKAKKSQKKPAKKPVKKKK